jgi:transcription initiation factor IIF auxiliary subunit
VLCNSLMQRNQHTILTVGRLFNRTTKVKSLEENVASGQVQLEQNELDQLQTVIEAAEVQGDRYPQGFGQQLYADTPALE